MHVVAWRNIWTDLTEAWTELYLCKFKWIWTKLNNGTTQMRMCTCADLSDLVIAIVIFVILCTAGLVIRNSNWGTLRQVRLKLQILVCYRHPCTCWSSHQPPARFSVIRCTRMRRLVRYTRKWPNMVSVHPSWIVKSESSNTARCVLCKLVKLTPGKL